MSNLKEIKITVKSGENFTPNSLMLRYAAMHLGVEFEHQRYFETGLKISGDLYKYDHWKIEPGEDGTETVTLFMRKAEKELYRWSIECSWPTAGCTESVSVLADGLLDAKQLAKEAFQQICGAPVDEIEISNNVLREKADLGLELYKAVKEHKGYEKAAKFIQLGADVNYRYLPDEYNYTPLHMAAYNADFLKVELLVEAGCEMNPLDLNGCTPLDLAIARHNYPHVVEYLFEKGAMRGLDVVLHQARERSEALASKVAEREKEALVRL